MKNRGTFSFSVIFLFPPPPPFFFFFCLLASTSSFLVLSANFYLFSFSLIFLLFPFLFDLSAAALHMFCYLAFKFSSFNYSLYFSLYFGDVSFSFFIISIIKWCIILVQYFFRFYIIIIYYLNTSVYYYLKFAFCFQLEFQEPM